MGSLQITLVLMAFMVLFNFAIVNYYDWFYKSCSLYSNFGNETSQLNSDAQQTLDNYYANYGNAANQCKEIIRNEAFPVMVLINSVIVVGIARGLLGAT